jgi:3-phenylpropionate/trans-cinnamate dioxygenase ferredoxin subunit
VLVCPWHGFRYDVTTGRFADDPSAALESYVVEVKDGTVYLRLPEAVQHAPHPSLEAAEPPAPERTLAPGEFLADQLTPGKMIALEVTGERVTVYNVGGAFYATQDRCTHTDAPLSEGDLDGQVVTCPIHGSCFDVTTGAVNCGPAKTPLRTYQVVVEGGIGRVVDR